jgi:hypothetical protein
VTMKKLLGLSSNRILLVCGIGLMMTLGAFWHQQSNQVQVDRMNVLNQGVGTCFNRISQTFTAMMIRDIQSPYLHQNFMTLSDECLTETINGINPFRRNVGKGYETLSRLMSDVHWFHESVVKLHTPMIGGLNLDAPLSPLSERYSKMENLKTNLVDAIDVNTQKLREVQKNDEILMGIGLIIFVLSLSVLSLKEFNRLQLQRDIEKQALNLLKSGQANVGAMVDQIVDRALMTQGTPVTAQVFRDYHGQILERMAVRSSTEKFKKAEPASPEDTKDVFVAPKMGSAMPSSDEPILTKSSLKEVLISLQNLHGKEAIQISEVRDVQLRVDYESLEQMMNAAVSKLMPQKQDHKKIMVSNQIHSDKTIVNIFLSQSTFSASELEFATTADAVATEIDMNLLILKEIAQEAGVHWYIENKTDRNGMISGMNIRMVVGRVPKDSRAKNLISVMKGKKKDIAREMVN